ncbi:hypothetical protein CcCBS67573_g05302 [Chytriomyces confervae]|uniref:RRM domain-containing protein n=1 Tax=Chytriomyces confervae TaxID=246404 RepID=A0A507FCY0_9FUNG|nr:hypothetical protein HDU80_011618 [Chytriomyces hyalinus]TPX73430.1 hypothetical protein CcCBS67573_g05302 [Chytriomyces confervae]
MGPKATLKRTPTPSKSTASPSGSVSAVSGNRNPISKKKTGTPTQKKTEPASRAGNASSSSAKRSKPGKKPIKALAKLDQDETEEEEEIEDVEIPDNEFEAVIAQDLYADDDDDSEVTDDEALLAGVLGSDDDDEEEDARPTGTKSGKAGKLARGKAESDGNEEDEVEVDELALQSAIVHLQDAIQSKNMGKEKKTLKERRKEKKAAGIVSQEAKSGEKRQDAKANPGKKTGVVYLGRIPHGFYEKEMKSYFSQFGEVLKLRLSRNKKTGASKHYAFLEFPSQQVAQIVADTMHGYLLFNQILQCQVVPHDKLHPDTFKGHDRRFKTIPWNKLERQRINKPLDKDDVIKRTRKLVARENLKRQRLAELGVEYEFGGYAQAAKRAKGAEEVEARTESGKAAVRNAITKDTISKSPAEAVKEVVTATATPKTPSKKVAIAGSVTPNPKTSKDTGIASSNDTTTPAQAKSTKKSKEPVTPAANAAPMTAMPKSANKKAKTPARKSATAPTRVLRSRIPTAVSTKAPASTGGK